MNNIRGDFTCFYTTSDGKDKRVVIEPWPAGYTHFTCIIFTRYAIISFSAWYASQTNPNFTSSYILRENSSLDYIYTNINSDGYVYFQLPMWCEVYITGYCQGGVTLDVQVIQ